MEQPETVQQEEAPVAEEAPAAAEAEETPAAAEEAPAAEEAEAPREVEAAPEPEPEPAPAPEPEVEEEVAAKEMYKTGAHQSAAKGAPFDPTAPGNHPYHDAGDCKMYDNFYNSSTEWIAYTPLKEKDGCLEFYKMGDSVASLKESLDGTKQIFYLLKCHAIDEKANVVSERLKIMRIVQLGSKVPIMKRRYKTKAWIVFKEATPGTAKKVEFDETDPCDWKKWAQEIQRAGGAHQPTQFSFGANEIYYTNT